MSSVGVYCYNYNLNENMAYANWHKFINQNEWNQSREERVKISNVYSQVWEL